MRLAVVVAVVFVSADGSEGSGFGSSGDPDEDEEDTLDEAAEEEAGEDEEDGAEEEEPEEPASVVIVRNSLLHQPSLPSAVFTLAQPELELSVTVSFVPCGMVRRAV